MFASDRILALDIGASKLVLAEFSTPKVGTPELIKYGIQEFGVEPEGDADLSAYIVSGIRDIMREQGIDPAPMLMTISGQSVFPRYVKLPPVTRDKVLQIIQYEAEQNVPFPIDEVVWDYQLIGDAETGEQNVMLVAVKIENVKALTDCVQAAGLEPEVVDVAPMALYNAVRFNYQDLEGCTMVLDIGARSSNLIFIEDERIFSRSIPVAGNAITQELMKEFDISFKEAEQLKVENAFVAFGGVYAGPDNDTADRVSKIVRNVITRLHAEVNRSVNFYRSQQAGSPPSLILLTGGSSIIPHTDTFFREKLKVDVEYLNPFVGVSVGAGIDAERIEKELNMLGEVTGLALRRSLTCPVEINLMPPDLVSKKELRRRQPFFILAAVGIAMIMLCWWVYTFSMKRLYRTRIETVTERVLSLDSVKRRLVAQIGIKRRAQGDLDNLLSVAAQHTRWSKMLETVHRSMYPGMWLISMTPVRSEKDGLTHIEIAGIGFKDKLKQVPVEGTDTPLDSFVKRLRKSKYFTDETNITELPPNPDAFAQRFVIKLALAKPMKRPPRKRGGA